MTVIFATYHNFLSNSSIQVHSLANRLADLGHRVHVCVPDGVETASLQGRPLFGCWTYAEALANPGRLAAAGDAPVIHAWTPREGVRKFTTQLHALLGGTLAVHLEDNEEFVTASNLGRSHEEMLALPEAELDALIPDSLSHPRGYRTFLESADGVTVLIDRLADFVPAGRPSLMFWPAHNAETFRETPLLLEDRRALGIADHEKVVAYVGNVTSANRREVASLYLAMIILRRQGHAIRLLRAGQDYAPLFETGCAELTAAVIPLGHVRRHGEIPRVLAMADFFVQPGRADPYNDFRFPSKLPEFFSIGRPVLLPHSNLGRFVRDGEDAVVLREGHAMEIAARLQELIRDPAKCERLSRGALAFCREHFDWKKAARALHTFYENLGAPAAATTP